MDDEHRDEGMDDALEGWELDQAQASARDTAPIVATMYRELRTQGLSVKESVSLAAAWIAAVGREEG